MAELLSLLSQGFYNQQQIAQLESFYNLKLTEFGSSANIVKNSIDEVKLDLKWAEEHLHHALDYMVDVTGSASIVSICFTLLLTAISVMFW